MKCIQMFSDKFYSYFTVPFDAVRGIVEILELMRKAPDEMRAEGRYH